MGIIGTRTIVATILNTESLSDIVELDGASLVRISMPAAWTAAEISFQVDDGDGTFRDLWMEWNVELYVETAVGRSVEMSVFLQGLHLYRIKVRSGTGGAPVAQGGDREIGLVVGVR